MSGAACLMNANPDAAAVITVAGTRVAPAVLLAVLPLPVVVIDPKLKTGLIIASLFDAPAIAFVVADDRG